MAVTAEQRRWDALLAARTRGDVGEGIASVLAMLGMPDLISFAGGFPDPETFPRERVASLLTEFAANDEALAFQYAPTQGLPGTRHALAGRIERLQGRRPGDAELVVTSGAIEALELLGKAFLDPGDLVLVEAPTYLGSLQAFRSFEARIAAVPIDEDGLLVDELERMLAGGAAPKLLYTIPDHQNPAGVTLAAERRGPLVELARRHGFLIVEDVAYRELGFDGQADAEPLEPGAGRGRADRDDIEDVLPGRPARVGGRAGGGLRRARRARSRRPTSAPARSASGCSRSTCAAAGSTSSSSARARSTAASASACSPRSSARCPTGRTGRRRSGGFFSWLTLPPGADSVDLARRAAEKLVGIVPGSLFYADGRGGDDGAAVVLDGRRVADRRRHRAARRASLEPRAGRQLQAPRLAVAGVVRAGGGDEGRHLCLARRARRLVEQALAPAEAAEHSRDGRPVGIRRLQRRQSVERPFPPCQDEPEVAFGCRRPRARACVGEDDHVPADGVGVLAVPVVAPRAPGGYRERREEQGDAHTIGFGSPGGAANPSTEASATS